MLRLTLEAQQDGRLEPAALLGFGPLLRQTAGARAAWLDLPASTDLPAQRRHQKPAPGFVLHPGPPVARDLLEGDRLSVDCLLLGTAVPLLGEVLEAVRQAGARGLDLGAIPLELAAAQTLGADGRWRPLWSAPQPLAGLAPELVRLDHWLDGHWPAAPPLNLEILTPMRLLAGGRILKAPRFDQLFPFLLRRVTSMLHAHCGLEPVEEPAALIAAARQVAAIWSGRQWLDWRDAGDHGPIGGVTGVLQLNGEGLAELLWVVLLATLFGVGKGAAYGSGSCRLLGSGGP